jgi:hypothetical protein
LRWSVIQLYIGKTDKRTEATSVLWDISVKDKSLLLSG